MDPNGSQESVCPVKATAPADPTRLSPRTRRLATGPWASWGTFRDWVRERKDNPLVSYNIPSRSVARLGLFLVLLLLIAAGLLAFAAKKVFIARDMTMDLWLCSLLGAPVLPALSFWLFGHRYRQTSHLEDLRLTSLAPGEAAFGAAWWPVCMSFGMFLPILTMQIILESVQKGSWVASAARLETLGLGWATATAIQVHGWFRQRNILRAFLLGVVTYGAAVFCTGVTAVMAGSYLEKIPLLTTVPGHDFATWLVLLVISPFVAVHFSARALRFSGAAFFSPIDMESLATLEWRANERLWRKEKEQRRGTLGRLFREVRPGCAADRAAVGVTVLLLVLGAVVGFASFRGDPWVGAARGAFGFNSLFAALLYCTILSVLCRTRGRGSARFPMISGAVTNSLLPYLCLPLLLTVVTASLSFWVSLEPDALSRPETIGLVVGWLVLMVFYVLAAVAVLLALLPRGRRSWVGGVCLAIAAVVHLVPLLSMGLTFHPSAFFFSVESLGDSLYLVFFVGGIWLLAAGLFHLAQRLHEREFAGLPRHRITTEFPPS